MSVVKSYRLYLARHAASDIKPGQIAGRWDVPPKSESLNSAGGMRTRLKAIDPRPQVVRSPALRCRLTAQACGFEADKIEPRLWEQDFGNWEGQSWDQVGADHEFWHDPARQRPPKGESFNQLIQRVELVALPDQDTIMFVHAGVIRAYLAKALSLRPEQALQFQIQPLSLTVLERYQAGGWQAGGWQAGGWSVLSVGQTFA